LFIGNIFDLGLFGLGIYAQVYRFRNVATPVERQQTKWIVFGLITAFSLTAFVLLAGPSPVFPTGAGDEAAVEKDTPVKETPAKETPAKETPTKEIPKKEAPTKEKLVKEPAEKAKPSKDKAFLDRFHRHDNVAPGTKSGGFSLGKGVEITGGAISGRKPGDKSSPSSPTTGFIGIGVEWGGDKSGSNDNK
jgi:hypothetical protein